MERCPPIIMLLTPIFCGELAEVFTIAQIIELGFSCAERTAVHRFIHSLDIYNELAST
jgi:hypothetical protein